MGTLIWAACGFLGGMAAGYAIVQLCGASRIQAELEDAPIIERHDDAMPHGHATVTLQVWRWGWDGGAVWVTADCAGKERVGYAVAPDVDGEVTLYLDSGRKYYLWHDRGDHGASPKAKRILLT